MGKYNSSKYRVRPLMEIVENSPQAFEQLLTLVKINVMGAPRCYCYDGENKHEKQLKPSKAHLSKLIDYVAAKDHSNEEVKNNKRQQLFFGDVADRERARQEAQNELNSNYDALTASSKKWYVFEGFTNPDIFIEGDDYIIICEGKWTEQNITTHTTHIPCRNQMIRHIQGALNYSAKKVYAFYIVDEDCGYTEDLEKVAFAEQLSKETIELDEDEKAKILAAFCGFTTWQNIKNTIPEVEFPSKEELDFQ